jgi:hypothetical protein
MSNNEPTPNILSLLQASNLVDYDQRSALGIARTWLEKHEAFVPTTHPSYQKRDALAQLLIDRVAELDHEDAVTELAHAREVINEPFKRDGFVGTAKEKKLKATKVDSNGTGG